jgi:hypothetical protein
MKVGIRARAEGCIVKDVRFEDIAISPTVSCAKCEYYRSEVSTFCFEEEHNMILGMSVATYTFLHVLISLIGIGSGFIVMFGFLTGKRFAGLTAVFLLTTVLTSLTGFGFPLTTFYRPTKLDPIAGGAGGGNSSALRISSGRLMALDLRGRRFHCALSQCFRLDRAGLPQGTGPQSTGSDAVRATVFGHAALRSSTFRRADDFSGKKVSRRGGASRLTVNADLFAFLKRARRDVGTKIRIQQRP